MSLSWDKKIKNYRGIITVARTIFIKKKLKNFLILRKSQKRLATEKQYYTEKIIFAYKNHIFRVISYFLITMAITL